MLSNMVRLHPELLSVSEFFTSLTSRAFRGRRPAGETVFRRLNTLSPGGRALLDLLPEHAQRRRRRPSSMML